MDSLIELRHAILQAAAMRGEGHVPSSFSILEIVHTLYKSILTDQDKFILSKGHGALALYAVLGILPRFASGELDGHPNRLQDPRIVATTGSLGHGLPIATGIALSKKLRGEPGFVYVLVGDQELQEGSNWEALLFAATKQLNNLIVLVDDNNSSKRSVLLSFIQDKLGAFGIYTCASRWGNDERSISSWLWHIKGQAPRTTNPSALVLQTKKGYGCPEMEADPQKWHHAKVTGLEVLR